MYCAKLNFTGFLLKWLLEKSNICADNLLLLSNDALYIDRPQGTGVSYLYKFG